MLTRDFNYGYDGSLNTSGGLRLRQFGDFFMPQWRMRTGNILNTRRRLEALSESATLLKLKEVLKTSRCKMQNALSIFNYQNNQIRTSIINEQPYFCGVDICNVLSIKNNRNVISRLKDGVHTVDIIDNMGRTQPATFINEKNVYKVIFQSRKPEAEAFADWVCGEVLPSIRKTGQYVDRSRFAELPFDPVPYTPADFVGDKEFMNAIGGMVKKCCAVAIKDAFTDIAQKEPVKVTWPQGKKLDEHLTKVATAILDYGQHRETTGRVQGMLTAALDPEFNKIKQKLI